MLTSGASSRFSEELRMTCLFCDIAGGKIESKRLHEDAQCIAFEDVNPQAPTHVLVVPREHRASSGRRKR